MRNYTSKLKILLFFDTFLILWLDLISYILLHSKIFKTSWLHILIILAPGRQLGTNFQNRLKGAKSLFSAIKKFSVQKKKVDKDNEKTILFSKCSSWLHIFGLNTIFVLFLSLWIKTFIYFRVVKLQWNFPQISIFYH